MAIAWIAEGTETNLIEAFRAAQWDIQLFTPIEFEQAKRYGLKNVSVIVFELRDGSLLDMCQETCQKMTTPIFVIVQDLAYAQAALEAGVDDFLVAPFNPIEALLRVHKLARSRDLVHIDDLEIDLAAWTVCYAGRRIPLSPLEFRFLACLAKRVGQMVTPTTILEEVWEGKYATVGQLKNCAGRVRRKIEPALHDPQFIITIPGGGYRLRNQRQWESNWRDAGR